MTREFVKKTAVLPGGLRIAYMEASDGGQETMLWIHGMGSYREAFHPLFTDPPVPARHIALDLPGFGDSGHLVRRHQLVDYAETVQSFLDALGIAQAVLIGHSFGGMVAGETLARFPERVSGAILISAAGWFDPSNALRPIRYAVINRVGIWITGMEPFGRRMLMALGVNPETVSKADRRRLKRGWRRAYEMARMGSFYHSENFAKRVLSQNCPVAVIHGDRDILFPLSRVQQEIGPYAPLWVIEGAGHLPFYSHPEHFRTAFQEACRYIAAPPHSDSR